MASCCSPERANGEGMTRGSGENDDRQARAVVCPARELFTPIRAGQFHTGTEDPRGYPSDGEGLIHEVELDAFEISEFSVANDRFSEFVEATGPRSTAEECGDSSVFGNLLPDDFPPTREVAAAPRWRQVEGASWQHPEGPQSDIAGRGDHPVVQVGWIDAMAYCEWSGTRLPTEAEWERAARGGVDSHHFPWGDGITPDGVHRSNVFQGSFPSFDSGDDGWIGTSPVHTFEPNEFGLHNMTRNVWEWCLDWFDPTYYARSPRASPSGPAKGSAKATRGGPYLCHESYCWRYRVDSRSANTSDSTTGNTGFRVAAQAT
jgi:formylglycine-generating enzyme